MKIKDGSDKITRPLLIRIIISIMALVLVVVGLYTLHVVQSIQATFDNVYVPVTLTREVDLEPVTLMEEDLIVMPEPISILLLGIDQDNPNERGRSDSMMLVTINPEKKSTQILSLARDTKVDIIGAGVQDKLNHAYAFGGAQMTIDTVQHLLDIPIDFFIEINMDGFMALVDVVGGVTVYNDFDFTQSGHHFPAGEITLTDSEAVLYYVRMRKQDPNGDFGRQARQRDVLVALVNELSRNAITNYGEILEVLGDNMGTNLTLDRIISLATNYLSALNNITQFELRGTGERIDGIFYQVLSYEELYEMRNILQTHLALSASEKDIYLEENILNDVESFEHDTALMLVP